MAKYINPPFDMNKELELFKAALNGGKFYTDFSYKVQLPKPAEAEATLLISPTAYIKMTKIVQNCSKEVAWHGTVKKLHTGAYYIEDVFLYPQKVTGVTVESDDDKYPTWVMGLDDETFNSMRFQGHSHVNMGVTPSLTDKRYYEEVLNNLNETDFYIFMILNKSNDCYFEIHDLEDNLIYENKDVHSVIDIIGLEDLTKQLKTMVLEEKKVVAKPSYSWTPQSKEQKENKKKQVKKEKEEDSWWNGYYGGGRYYD